MKFRGTLSIAAVALIFSSAVASAQVDCSDANNLCTGNPCTIGEVEVLSPCVVDFGARALVLSRTLKIPNGGELSFTAEDIEVNGKILGRHAEPGGVGADVTLTASHDVEVLKRIDVSGRTSAGTLQIDAGNVVVLRAGISAAAKGMKPTAAGGTVVVTAQNSIDGTHKGRIKVKGKKTPGGNVTLSAGQVAIQGKIDARGSVGGIALVTGSVGAVVIADKIEVDGMETEGGSITLSSPDSVVSQRRLDADGKTAGGTINVVGGAVDLSKVQARGNGSTAAGGLVTISGQDVRVGDVRLRGRQVAGTLDVSAVNTLTVAGQVDMRSTHASGGTMTLTAGGDLTVMRKARADGDTVGGTMTLESTGGAVILEDRLNVDCNPGAGGSISITAATDVSMEKGMDAGGAPGGTVVVSAGNNLTADGHFIADTGGCIAFSAGGTIDVSGASISPPLSGSCP